MKNLEKIKINKINWKVYFNNKIKKLWDTILRNILIVRVYNSIHCDCIVVQ